MSSLVEAAEPVLREYERVHAEYMDTPVFSPRHAELRAELDRLGPLVVADAQKRISELSTH